MNFVTYSYYLYFLPAVILLTFGLTSKRRKKQILVLVSMSYLFFWLASGWHLLLLLLSTCIDWTAGKKISKSDEVKIRKRWLLLSLIINLGLLATFKYLDFIIETLNFFFLSRF